MRDNDETWQAVTDYSSRWIIERSSGSGGQGYGHEVRRVGTTSSNRFFLKILKDQTNPQRRARMFREAVALATYDHPRIPRLIESNAQLRADRKVDLYLVTDLIRGSALGAFHRKPFAFADAVSITEQLAETVAYLQRNEALHRDIKPDNVMLRDGTIDAVLIDFGLTFNRRETGTDLTGQWEELGNRFLRVPELSSYSSTKQDYRTDILFLTGILFYCLTGQVPAVLEDGTGKLPHQRLDFDLAPVAPDVARARSLARLFDQGFQPRLSDRFPTIEAFRSALSELKSPLERTDLDMRDMMARAARLGGTGEMAARHRRRASAVSEVWLWMDRVVRAIQVLTKGEFVVTSSGDYDPDSDHPYRNIGLHHYHRGHLSRFWLKTTCRFVGEDLVVTVAEESGDGEEEVLRTSVADPHFEQANENAIQSRLVIGLEQLPLA